MRIEMIEKLFHYFGAKDLVDANFHKYLYEAIKGESFIAYRVRMATLLGSKVVAPLIRSKKYRQDLTDFIDELRRSKNFRDRQMYLYVAMAAFKAE